MAKKKKHARRSAIVPSVLLSATLMSGAAVVPMLSGCGGGERTVACVGFNNQQCPSVASIGFDMSAFDGVAAMTFDLSSADLESKD
jgi:hypothetical protein